MPLVAECSAGVAIAAAAAVAMAIAKYAAAAETMEQLECSGEFTSEEWC